MRKGNYRIEDYLLDQYFIHLVKNPNGPQRVFWQAWLSSHPDQSEKIFKAREIILSIEVRSFEPLSDDYDEVIESLLTQRDRNETGKKYNYQKRVLGMRTMKLKISMGFSHLLHFLGQKTIKFYAS